MATNPARPQFQDTIDEAWGDQVADHVIRRYPDAASRDADLAGIAAADLQGQVVAVGAYLQMHDGTQWRGLDLVPAARAALNGTFQPSGWAQAALVTGTGRGFNKGGVTIDAAHNAFVVPVDGLYLIDVQLCFYSGSSGNVSIEVRANDSANRVLFAGGTGGGLVTVGKGSGIVPLAAGDYVNVYGQSQGGTSNVTTWGGGSDGYNWLDLALVGRT